MSETTSPKKPPASDRRRVALPTFAVSAGFSAVLTYFLWDARESAAEPGFLQLMATWLMFTILLAAMFAAGIWRMAGTNGDAPVSPMGALIALASTAGVIALTPIGIHLSSGAVDTKTILYGALALCVVVVIAVAVAARYFINRAKPPAGSST